MNYLLSSFRTAIFYTILITSGIILTPWMFICALFSSNSPRARSSFFFLSYWWNLLLIKAAGIEIIVNKLTQEKYNFDAPAIIIANHPSTIDSSIIETIIQNTPRSWIIKQEFKGIPFWGFILQKMHILIARKNPKEAAIALTNGIKRSLATKSHIILFPEGTRTDNTTIYPFKKGYITLARTTDRPIICLGIFSSNPVLPKNRLLLTTWKTRINLVISKKIYYNDYESDEKLHEAIETWFHEKHTLYNRTRSSGL